MIIRPSSPLDPYADGIHAGTAQLWILGAAAPAGWDPWVSVRMIGIDEGRRMLSHLARAVLAREATRDSATQPGSANSRPDIVVWMDGSMFTDLSAARKIIEDRGAAVGVHVVTVQNEGDSDGRY